MKAVIFKGKAIILEKDPYISDRRLPTRNIPSSKVRFQLLAPKAINKCLV